MMSYQREYSVKKTLRKDGIHKKLSGVCGGIAAYYQLVHQMVYSLYHTFWHN